MRQEVEIRRKIAIGNERVGVHAVLGEGQPHGEWRRQPVGIYVLMCRHQHGLSATESSKRGSGSFRVDGPGVTHALSPVDERSSGRAFEETAFALCPVECPPS